VSWYFWPSRGCRLDRSEKYCRGQTIKLEITAKLEEAEKLANAGASIRELATDFESLGNNCELGIVQRSFGAEPLGLLRWAGINHIDILINALNGHFQGLGEPENVAYETLAGWDHPTPIDKRYGFYFHTDLDASKALGQPEELRKIAELEGRRLKFLAGKLFNLLQTGEKILVYRQKQGPDPAQIERLFKAVRVYGRNTLLVVIEDPSRDPGSIEIKKDGLILAYIGCLSNSNPPQIDFDTWRRIIVETHEAWKNSFIALPGKSSYFPPLKRAMQALDFLGEPDLRRRVIDCLIPVYANAVFDFNWYISKYADVAAAVAEGLIAKEHFCRHGYFENRLPAQLAVDDAWYLENYRAVGEAIKQRRVLSPSDHYNRIGYFEGLAPSGLVYPQVQIWNEIIGMRTRDGG